MRPIRQALAGWLLGLLSVGMAGAALAQDGREPASMPAQAQQAEAQQFLRHVYAHYYANAPVHPQKDADIYDDSLLALMRANTQAHPADEVPYLDGDPLCDCQDYGDDFDMRQAKFIFKPADDGQLEAAVTFSNQGQRTTLRLLLRHTAHGWRIADVISPDDGSLRAALQRDTQERLEENKHATPTPGHGAAGG